MGAMDFEQLKVAKEKNEIYNREVKALERRNEIYAKVAVAVVDYLKDKSKVNG